MNEFLRLSQMEQASYVYLNGVYVGKFTQGETPMVLYQVHDFYVEICYKKYRRFISSVRCFESTEELDPYLVQISIEELLNS